jgi:cell division protein FtsB
VLLNEVQRQQRTLDAQAQQIAGVKAENQALQTAVAELKAELEAALVH